MNVELNQAVHEVLSRVMERGGYASPADTIAAALAALEQQLDQVPPPGSLDALLAEGEADIARGDVVDADEVFDEIRGLTRARRSKAG